MPEYESWKEHTNTSGWAIKYYKGLGTSDAKEAKEYFADIDDHRKTFIWSGEYKNVDGRQDRGLYTLATKYPSCTHYRAVLFVLVTAL